MRAWACATALALCALFVPVPGRAQSAVVEPPAPSGAAAEFGARARAPGPIAAEDATASGTAIDLRDRARALEQVGEALVEVPGVRVRSTGGFGAFSGVALRGAEDFHTTVLLGSIPLNTSDNGAFDLSLLPLAALDAVEIYRGGAPVWLSDGSIGGVVRLLPRAAEQNLLRATVGYGSFGRLSLSATSSVVRAGGVRPALFSYVGFARADNDYAYVDDGRTRFDTNDAPASADDRTLHQRNAQVNTGDGLLHAGVDALGGRLEFVLAAHGDTEGVPGPLAAPTLNVHRQLVRMLGAASWEREKLEASGERGYRVQLLASGSHQQNRFTDLLSELGTSKTVASNDVWQRAYVRAAGSVRVLGFLEPTLIGSFTRDDYRPEDPLAFTAPPRPSGRSSEAVALETRVYGHIGDVALELRPSARVQANQTAIWIDAPAGANGTQQNTDAVTSTYRVAGLVAPLPALAISASAATGLRLPSMYELFGDRVFQEPEPHLLPERSKTVDTSVVVHGATGALSGSAELRGFALWLDDMIRLERTAPFTVRPENIASGRVLGIEFGTHATYGRHLSLAGALTAMQTRNQFDKLLPLRPPVSALLRPELALFPAFAQRLSLFAEVDYVSYVYLDESNRTLLSGRTLFATGAALRFLDGRFVLQARLRNVFDVLTTDVLSRPLPGREFLVSITIEDGPG